MDSKRNTEDLYNIKTYTDEELYEILDITKNPTDRELEAKILFFIHKYSSMDGRSSKKLAKFFDDIYNHFFEVDAEEETDDNNIEGFEAGGISYEDALIKGNIDLNDRYNMIGNINDPFSAELTIREQDNIRGNIRFNPTKGNIVQEKEVLQKSGATNSSVTFVKSLDYATGRLNPLIQQTIRRIVSVDSKYRDNKQTLSTDFTFNLSEPLKDVVSLKLYSIQIPYSWYTVNAAFGGNFFYIKGDVPGIDNEFHDMIIDIPAGNYDQIGLGSAITTSIGIKKQVYSDVSFGDSAVSINVATSKTTSNIYLQKKYDENSYYLDFAGCGESTDSIGIKSALGYSQEIYYPNILYSGVFNNIDSTFYNTGMFELTNLNNFIHVVIYQGPDEWDHITNISYDASFDIVLNLSTSTGSSKYSRSQIAESLNNAIKTKLEYLSDESGITDPDYNSNPFNNSLSHNQTIGKYQLKIKPSRGFTRDKSNIKIAIKFPSENNIWTGGPTSCFGFNNVDGSYWNEMSNIISEQPIIINTQNYPVFNGTYVLLKCNEQYFNLEANNIKINIPINETGYSLDEYIAAINTGISTSGTYETVNSPVNSGSINKSNAFKDNFNNFNLNLVIEQSFNEDLYEADFRNSILKNNLFLNKTKTDDNKSITGTVTITDGDITFDNGDPQISIKNEVVNGSNIITGLTGNIVTTGTTNVNNNNIIITSNIVTTNYTSTEINNGTITGSIVTKNNSSTKINGSSSMNLSNQIINVDNDLNVDGNVILSGEVNIVGNKINNYITFNNDGTIYSNGRTVITGDSIINNLDNNEITIIGDVETDGIITINNNTQIIAYSATETAAAKTTTIKTGEINTNGQVVTSEELRFEFITNNSIKVLNAIYTTNNTYNFSSIGTNSIDIDGTINFSGLDSTTPIDNSEFKINFADNALTTDTMNLKITGKIDNDSVNSVIILNKNQITSITGTGTVSIVGNLKMNNTHTVTINDSDSIIQITNANITIVGGFSYTTTQGATRNITLISNNSVFTGTLWFYGSNNIDITSLPTGDVIVNDLTIINGVNTMTYTTFINNTSPVTGYVNITNGTIESDMDGLLLINQDGQQITTDSNMKFGTLIDDSVTVTGTIITQGLSISATSGKKINVLNQLTLNKPSLINKPPLIIQLNTGVIKNTYSNLNDTVRLEGTSIIDKSHTIENFTITDGDITTDNVSVISTQSNASINGIGSTITTSNININGSSVINGTIAATIETTIDQNIITNGITINNSTTTITGNITTNPSTQISLISGEININGGIVITGITTTVENTEDIYYLTDLTKTYVNKRLVNKAYSISNGDTIMVIKAKRNTGFGNDNVVTYEVIWDRASIRYSNVINYIIALKNAITTYVDPMTGLYLFGNTDFILYDSTVNSGVQTFSLKMNIRINKKILAKNYNVQFVSSPLASNSWYTNLKIDYIMNTTLALNTSRKSSVETFSLNDVIIVNTDGSVLIKGFTQIDVNNDAIIFNENNNKFFLRAYENGVYSRNKENDITFIIPITYSNGVLIRYSIDMLIFSIQQSINSVIGIVSVTETIISTISVIENGVIDKYAKIRCNINRTYTTKDFKLVFYDTISFVKCYVGAGSVQNITWDTTLGWLLGYHDNVVYNFLNYNITSNGYVTIESDSVVILNLYNYFMICIDDYNSNQINDGLVTITNRDANIPLPSYTSRSNYQCDPASGEIIYNSLSNNDGSRLTQNKKYALSQITNTNEQNASIDNKIYTSTPSIRNVFGLIPIKPGQNGQIFVEYGGTLQNQDRTYFGPVNISRMSVRLITDRGDILNLNGANWSFALICEQLSNLKTQNAK